MLLCVALCVLHYVVSCAVLCCVLLVCCWLLVWLFVCRGCGWFLFVVRMRCLYVGYVLTAVWLVSDLNVVVRSLSSVVRCGVVAVCCGLLVSVFVVRCVLAGCYWLFPVMCCLLVLRVLMAAVWLLPVDYCRLLLRVV